VNLTYFNEDLLCSHKNLTATTNKRLVSSAVWRIFEAYFESSSSDACEARVFTNKSRECKTCQKHLEENDTKQIMIKSQKDYLKDLYLNKSRPNLMTDQNLSQIHYLVPSEFLRTWRAIIKQSKFRNIQISNEMILCPHKKLAFDETSIDSQL